MQMRKHILQSSLDRLRYLFENGWSLDLMNPPKSDEPQMLIQIPASDIISVAVEAALITCQIFIDSQEKINNRSLLNRTEAAEYLGCTRQTLRNYENLGIVVPIYLNGHPCYRQEDLDNANDHKRAPFKREGNKDIRLSKGKRKGGKDNDLKQC